MMNDTPCKWGQMAIKGSISVATILGPIRQNGTAVLNAQHTSIVTV